MERKTNVSVDHPGIAALSSGISLRAFNREMAVHMLYYDKRAADIPFDSWFGQLELARLSAPGLR